jgi:hypothetical protein
MPNLIIKSINGGTEPNLFLAYCLFLAKKNYKLVTGNIKRQ